MLDIQERYNDIGEVTCQLISKIAEFNLLLDRYDSAENEEEGKEILLLLQANEMERKGLNEMLSELKLNIGEK